MKAALPASPPANPLSQRYAATQITPELFQGFDTATQITALALWRATGSTGAWLVPKVVDRKRADCGV